MEWVIDGVNLSVFTITFLILAAFIAGFVDSLAGGGGLVFIPSCLFLGLPANLTLEQNKATSTFGTLAAIINYGRKGAIHLKTVSIGIPFSIMGSYCGAKILLLISDKYSTEIILFLLPFALLVSFLAGRKKVSTSNISLTNNSTTLFIGIPIVTFLMGIYDGFFGPGTGTLLILFLTSFLKLNLLNAAASSKVFNFCSNITAFVTFLLYGNLVYALILPLSLSNILGNLLGSQLALKKGNRILKKALTGSISLLIISLSIKYFIY